MDEIIEEGASPSEVVEDTGLEVEPAVEPDTTLEPTDEDFHKAELERLEKRNRQAEHTIEKLRKEKTGVQPEELDEIENRITSKLESKYQEDAIENAAGRYSETETEKTLLKTYFKGLSPELGSIDERMRMASAIANRNRTKGQIDELRHSLASKGSRGVGSDAGARLEPKVAPKFTAEQLQMAQAFGAKPEEMFKDK